MENQYVCINDVFTHHQRLIFTSLPVKSDLYTLKEEVFSPIDNKKGLVFYELPNPCHENGQEFSFRPSRFKLVDASMEEYVLSEYMNSVASE